MTQFFQWFDDLYRLLRSERQPISDVPAIYFVEPTTENVQRISEVK